MSVLTILSEEFLTELPDDPHAAFALVLRRADIYVSDALKQVDDNENSSWHYYETAQHTAMNTIIAAAKRFQIEPFASMIVPPRKNFSSEQFTEFKVDLDHYTAQLLLDNSIRTKRESIKIEPKIKDRLRQHIHGIKVLIDQAEISDSRRAALHRRIEEFEAALEKHNVNVVVLAGILVGILSASANVATLADSNAMHKLVSTIMSTMGHAKAIDDAKREVSPMDAPQPLLPPRPNISREHGFGSTSAPDLDDDIPF